MKADCIASLSASLTSTSRWRAQLSDRDPRYGRAARRLLKLAGEAASLSDAQWQALQPHFHSERWREAVRETSRDVGFAFRKASFAFYLKNLVRLLEAPASGG
jgi:hypothetical protein